MQHNYVKILELAAQQRNPITCSKLILTASITFQAKKTHQFFTPQKQTLCDSLMKTVLSDKKLHRIWLSLNPNNTFSRNISAGKFQNSPHSKEIPPHAPNPYSLFQSLFKPKQHTGFFTPQKQRRFASFCFLNNENFVV